MTLYIAGPIAGDPGYRAKFKAAEALLEEQGHTVLNPAVLPDGLTKAEYMRIDFGMIDAADAVCFLPGAWESEGAMLEFHYCKYTGKQIFVLAELLK